MEKYTYIRKTITWDSRRYEVRGKTEQEACEKLADLVVSLKRGEFAASGQTTVEQWFQQWMQTYKIPSGITPKSLRLYDEKYNGYIGPAIGQKKLQDVRDLHLQTILNTQAGRSYSHVSKLRMVLQELFRQARRSRLIVFDPAEGLQLPESTKRSHRPITAAERRHILALAKEHRAGLWVLTILYAGLRPGETAALSWKDIDFDRNEIHVYKAIESGTKTVNAPKTPAGVRDIPMRQELRDRLLDAQGRQLLAELLPLLGGDAGAQGAALAAAVGQGEVFFDAHRGSGAHHGVLEDAAEILGAFVLRQAGDVHAVQNNIALVGGENAGDQVQGGGFAGTVAADDGDEIAVLQSQVQAVDGAFLVDGPGIKRLIKIFQFKHGAPPLRLRALLCSGCACSSSRARPGTRPPPGRRRASSRCCSGPWSGRSG